MHDLNNYKEQRRIYDINRRNFLIAERMRRLKKVPNDIQRRIVTGDALPFDITKGNNVENEVFNSMSERIIIGKRNNVNYCNNLLRKSSRYQFKKVKEYSVSQLINICNIRKIDYIGIYQNSIKCISESKRDINIFLPCKGRIDNFNIFVKYLKNALLKASLRYRVILLENDDNPYYENIAKNNDFDYIFIPLSISCSENLIAKSLLWNIGYLSIPESEWYIFHDIDILIENDFFIKFEKYLKPENYWIQPYTNKRVKRLSKNQTQQIKETYVELKKINCEISQSGSTGGIIAVQKNIFEEVGGFDPEFFYGYSIEDSFIWVKMETVKGFYSLDVHAGGATYADNPLIEVYHLFHNDQYQTPILPLGEDTYFNFIDFDYENRIQLITLKRNLLAEAKKQIQELKNESFYDNNDRI